MIATALARYKDCPLVMRKSLTLLFESVLTEAYTLKQRNEGPPSTPIPSRHLALRTFLSPYHSIGNAIAWLTEYPAGSEPAAGDAAPMDVEGGAGDDSKAMEGVTEGDGGKDGQDEQDTSNLIISNLINDGVMTVYGRGAPERLLINFERVDQDFGASELSSGPVTCVTTTQGTLPPDVTVTVFTSAGAQLGPHYHKMSFICDHQQITFGLRPKSGYTGGNGIVAKNWIRYIRRFADSLIPCSGLPVNVGVFFE